MVLDSDYNPIGFLVEAYANPSRVCCPMLYLLESHSNLIRIRLEFLKRFLVDSQGNLDIICYSI